MRIVTRTLSLSVLFPWVVSFVTIAIIPCAFVRPICLPPPLTFLRSESDVSPEPAIPKPQRVIRESELEPLLAEGWRFVTTLPFRTNSGTSRYLVNRRTNHCATYQRAIL